jgi:hypothetical protein
MWINLVLVLVLLLGSLGSLRGAWRTTSFTAFVSTDLSKQKQKQTPNATALGALLHCVRVCAMCLLLLLLRV